VVTLSDLVRYFRRYWKKAVMVAAPLAVFTFLGLGFGEKVYEAEARLLLRIQDTNVFAFNEMGHRPVTELSAPMLVNNHRNELKARRYMEYVWERLPEAERLAFIEKDLKMEKSWHRKLREAIGLAEVLKPAPPKDLFLAKLEKATRVEPIKESHIIRVQVRHTDRQLVASVANHYVGDYIRYMAEQESGTSKAASTYLEERSKELLNRVMESERELDAYRKANNLFEDTAAKDVYGDQARQITTLLTDARKQHSQIQNDHEAVKRAMAAGRDLIEVKIIADNSDVSNVRKLLDAKVSERAPIAADCGPRHPKMVALNKVIETLQLTLNRNIDAAVAIVAREEEKLAAQVKDIEKQLNEARAKALDTSDENSEQNRLAKRVEANRKLYEDVMMRREQADLTGDFKENGLLRVADVASAPEKPVKPSKPIAALASIIVFGLVMFGVPVGAGMYADHLAPVLRGEQNVSAQSSAIMHSPRADVPPAAQQDTAVIAVLPDVDAGTPSMLLTELLRPSANGAAASLQSLTTGLEHRAMSRNGPGIVLVTSAGQGEGKSILATALSATFCSQGRSVFLVECNPAAPSLSQWLPGTPPNSAWASDMESLRYGTSGLFVLPAHDLPSSQMSELVDGFRSWIARAQNSGKVDWIILDSASLLHNFADVAPLVSLATDMVFVHDQAISSATKVKAALNMVKPMLGEDVLRGLVLNRQNVTRA
jgi:uncharacterized protein involved in exopolysaccharide biosynthesis/Mrp family chromosome partitioning ATPase